MFGWLNEESRLFLQRGYLLEGVSAEERIRQIADRAEEILKYEGYADKFYDYMSRGWYSLSTPVWCNFGLNRGLPISCLTGDSWINTEHEGGTQIKDIKIGDRVLTHKGRYRRVTNIQSRKSKDDIYELKVVTRKTPIKITGNHPVLTNLGWVRVDELDPSIHYIATNNKVEYEPKDVILTFENPDKQPEGRFEAKTISSVSVDAELAWALGLWFAEGSETIDKNKSPNGLRITMGVDYKHDIEKWLNVMKNKFGINGNIYLSEVKRNGKISKWYTCNINSVVLGKYFRKTFGKGCKEKNITKEFRNLPSNLLQAFFEGFYLGDGKKTVSGQQTLTISNAKLAMSLYEIGLKCGYRMGLQMQAKPGKYATTKHVYRVDIYCRQGKINMSVNNGRAGIEFEDGNRYCPFKIKKLDHNETVYDLTVEEDHSFSVAGVIVHNCYGSFISDTTESLLSTATEIGMMSKYGGGTSAYFGKVRGRGEPITNNGESSGSVHFMAMYDSVIETISQGCYDDKTEILTNNGWKLFSALNKEDKVAQVLDNEEVEFVDPLEYFEYDVKENLILFKDSRNIDLLVTKNHNMVFKYETKKITDGKHKRTVRDEFVVKDAENCPLHRDIKYLHAGYLKHGEGLSLMERLYIAIQADGSKTKNCDNAVVFHFAKRRKINRLKWILDGLGLNYSESYSENDGTCTIYVNIGEQVNKNFDWFKAEEKSVEWCEEFILECLHWDGTFTSDTSGIYSSVVELNVDKLQEVCSLAGYKSYKSLDLREKEENKRPIYKIYMSKGNYFGVEKLEKEEVYYEGKVYCVEVPTNRLIVRRNGRTVVCGNSTRRGSLAVYQDVEHKDILEFLEIKKEGNPIQNLFTGVCVGDKWMEEMVAGDPEKRKVWAKVIEARFELGIPYIFFRDNVNNNKPQVYKDKGYDIHASNLCVSGDTKILTRDGYKSIESLEGQTVSCWNGEEWSDTPIFKTSESQPVLEVKLSNGQTIKATPYHKWYVVKQDELGRFIGEEVKRTHELKSGDKLAKYELEPVTHGGKELVHAYSNGFFTADGTMQTNGKPRISLYGNKKEIAPYFTGHYSKSVDSSNRMNLYFDEGVLLPKFFVPDTSYSVQSRLEWLAGLFDGDGTLTNNKGSESVQLVSTNLDFLKELHLMLQELGIDCKISLNQKAGYRKLPANDGSGELKDYWCNTCWRILIAGSQLSQLLELGFKAYRIKPTIREQNRAATRFVKIIDVVDSGESLPTYCGTEPLRNKLMFNGVLTGNCSEIMLPSKEDESFVCCLSSMNLLHYDEWKDTDAVEVLTYFLDAVMEEFIEKSADKPGLERANNFSKRHRALGLGVLGWHSLLQSKMIPFEGLESKMLNAEIFKLLDEKTLKATKKLAQDFGEPELLKGYGQRNTTRLAVAPTTSSAFILGQVSQSIEPLKSNYYIKELAKRKHVYKNPFLEELLEEKGLNDRETWLSIMKNDGSVQHLSELSEREKAVFKTFREISQLEVIQQAAQRQKYIDQGQSLNIIVNPQTPVKELNWLLCEAHKLGIKSLYYQHSVNAAQEFSQSLTKCVSCEG